MIKSLTHQFIGFSACVALFCAGFVPLSVAQVNGETEAFDPSTILPSPAPQSEELLAFDMTRIVSTQTRLIRYEATEYQRKVAESRARAFMAAHRRTVASAKSSTPPKETPVSKKSPKKPSEPQTAGQGKKEPKVAEKPAKETPVEHKPKKEIEGVDKPAALPRYIAVDTVKDKRASPKAKKVVMIWDTHAEALVGNNIYDVENPPRVGETKVFETYSAQYIGAGL